MMRIVIVETDGGGGLIHLAFEMATAFAARRHQIRLVTRTDYELADLPHTFGVEPVLRLWSNTEEAAPLGRTKPRVLRWARRLLRAARLTREWARLTWRLMRDPADLMIFSEILYPHLFVFPWLLKARGRTIAQICHEYAFQEREDGGRLLCPPRWLTAAGSRIFDRVYVFADSVRDGLLAATRLAPDRVVRIPHGGQSVFADRPMDHRQARLRLGLDANEPVILFFGNIRPSKGLDDLIAAFARARSLSSARLVIAGAVTRYSNADDIAGRIERSGIAARTVFRPGYVSKESVAAYFGAATVVVLPYRSATQSGVLHLAYQLGRPVIATRVGGLAEDVSHGESGLLVAPENVAELSAALDRLIEDRALCRKLGDGARRFGRECFSWEAAVRIIESSLPTPSGFQTRRVAHADADAGGAHE